MKLADLARGAGAVLEGDGDVEITGIAYDSRRVGPGDLFVAVQGLHVDGHDYVTEAARQGARRSRWSATSKSRRACPCCA